MMASTIATIATLSAVGSSRSVTDAASRIASIQSSSLRLWISAAAA
jgi:hypothetical protein